METLSRLLDPIEASQHLGITPELLHHYVRHGAKGRGGRRLACVPDGAAQRFTIKDLDDFDAWLRRPWAEVGAARRDPPQGVRDYLKVESGGVCPLCGSSGPFEDAHIEEWSVSRNNHHHNLLRMCTACHVRYDQNEIPRAEVERRKREAIGRLQSHIGRRAERRWPIPGAPPLSPTLVGRREELEEAADAISSGKSLAIYGAGGIGKTQLLLNALRLAAPERPILWLSVDGLGEAASLREALARVAQKAGIEMRNGRPLLNEARACVVLDGIERMGQDLDEVADLLEELLAEGFDTLILITTQVRLARLEFDRAMRLGGLDGDASLSVLGTDLADDATPRLLRFAEGHPLTLRLMRVLVRHFGSGASVHDELARRGESFVSDPQRAEHNSGTSLMACLALAYSRLDEAGRRLLWMVAASPAGFRPGLHSIAGSVNRGGPDASATLRAWHLVDQHADNEFEEGSPPYLTLTMLSPIKAFVMDAATADHSVDWREVALSFCNAQMLLTSFIQNAMLRGTALEVGKTLMSRELPNAIAAFNMAVNRADRDRALLPTVVSIAHATMMTLFTSGAFATGTEVMRRAARAAARTGSPFDAMQFLYQMQTLAERRFDTGGAAAAIAEAERIAQFEEGKPAAMLLLMRASAAERSGDYEQAAELAQQSYDMFRGIGAPEEEWRKSAGFALGRALEFGGRAAEALPFYREALEATEQENDPINRGSLLHHIGNCEAYAGRYQDAMHAYRKAGEQFVRLEATEFISNAIGEAGLILPYLDPPVGLPRKAAIEAAFEDIVDQFELLLATDMYGGRDPRVSLRKLIGILSLALHNGQEHLLGQVARDMYSRFVEPLDARSEPPASIKVLLYHVQWTIRLFGYLASLGSEQSRRRLRPSETTMLVWLAGRAFTSLERLIAEPLASYLRRSHGMDEIDTDFVAALMVQDDNDEARRNLENQAKLDCTDLGWLR